MTSGKFFFAFLAIFVAYNFVIADSFLISTFIGTGTNTTTNNFLKTNSPPSFTDFRQIIAFCPSSRGTGLNWLSYGMPPNCYKSGSQGPCRPNEILVPDRSDIELITTSKSMRTQRQPILGMCTSVVQLQTAAPPPPQPPSELTGTSSKFSSAYDMTPSKCRTNEQYSKILQKCIKSNHSWGNGGASIIG
ncbi:unnamed protein product [Orchesella dallaii]|uniref:Uncharacterized protein n=1 Tax=Orchesella dallaii TaxID=48710 RepID=A0ABP1QAH8_9HEXA